MRIPPCRICQTAYIKQNFGRIDFVVCESCYNKILEKNRGQYRYAELSIDAYRDTWGATNPNSRMQQKYVRAMNRRRKFAVAFCSAVFILFGVFVIGWCF